MECEVCGRRIYGSSRDVTIDGAKLTVCSECASFYSSSWKLEQRTRLITSRPNIERRLPSSKPKQLVIAEEMELAEDYSRRIRQAREKLGLSQKDLGKILSEKASFLQKLETSKAVPDEKLIKKLENTLKIKLLAPPPSTILSKGLLSQKPHELTLGDMAYFRKKKAASEAILDAGNNRT